MKLRWQNELLTYKDKKGKGYSPTYLKTVNCQLTAIFNYAMRYYNLQDNPCRKAGAIGKSKGEPKDFWMQEEFNAFLETVSDKPETRMAFLLLYWTGMRIGELLALTYDDINLDLTTLFFNADFINVPLLIVLNSKVILVTVSRRAVTSFPSPGHFFRACGLMFSFTSE